MNSIEFSKKCRPYNLQYKELFGYVPCRGDYQCSQGEYLSALLKAIETKQEIATFVPKRIFEPKENVRYNGFVLENGCKVEKLVEYKGLTLIKKYEQYYIRFVGGQHEECLCDLLITDTEALSIISNNEEIKKIRDSYKSKVPWTKEYFLSSDFTGYLLYRIKTMSWKYVKPLSDEESIEAFERLVNYAFPQSFKDCVKQYNGARPKRRAFDTNKKTGRELKSLLSFNREDKETVWGIYEWSKAEHQGKYIPFAIDNFGNLICFNRAREIVFINHETLELEDVDTSFEEFIGGLYMSAAYYKDDDTGNVVRNIQGYGVERLNKGSLVWENCGANSNYYREIFLGEGNNCLSSISRDEALNIISEWGATEY